MDIRPDAHLLEAVRAGAGLANLPMSLAASALGDGTLETVPSLPSSGPSGLSAFVVTAPGATVPKVRVFVDHVMAELPRRLARRA